MKVFVDSENRICDVGSTKDTSLTELNINEENNPFKDWSVAKICCYKVSVLNGEVTGYTPYVSSGLLSVIDRIGKQIDSGNDEISNAREGIMETYEETLINADQLAECRAALEEIYEKIEGGNT